MLEKIFLIFADTTGKDDPGHISLKPITDEVFKYLNPILTVCITIACVVAVGFFIKNCIKIIGAKSAEERHAALIAICWLVAAIIACGAAIGLVQVFMKVTNIPALPSELGS